MNASPRTSTHLPGSVWRWISTKDCQTTSSYYPTESNGHSLLITKTHPLDVAYAVKLAIYRVCALKTKKDEKRRQPPRPKGWQFSATDGIAEEENTEDISIAQEAKYTGNNTEHSPQNDEKQMESALVQINPQQQSEKYSPEQEIRGNKWAHSTESSDSEKEFTNEAQMAIVTATPNNEGWRKVEKKKGRKA